MSHYMDIALDLANIMYYEQQLIDEIRASRVEDEGSMPIPVVMEGSFAECDECKTKQVIYYMYGGTRPLCRQCFKDVTN